MASGADHHKKGSGRWTSEIAGLKSAELEMLAARSDVSGGSAKLEASLKLLGTTMVASRATYMTARIAGVASTTAGDSAVAAMMDRGSEMVAKS